MNKLLRFFLTLIVLNALFFYGIGEIDLSRPEIQFGVLIVNVFLGFIAFMLTMLYPSKNQ